GLPDCHVGFYDSLVVFDHRLDKIWIVSTGLRADGSRTPTRARNQMTFWAEQLEVPATFEAKKPFNQGKPANRERILTVEPLGNSCKTKPVSNFSRLDFLERVERIQSYIRSGDVYQVNLSQRFSASF